MHATISLRDLRLRAVIGVRPRERRGRQPLRIEVSLDVDLPDLPAHDTLVATVDYSALRRRIASEVEGSSFALIESLAHRLGTVCLEDPRAVRAVVTVIKPRALGRAGTAGVTVRVDRHA